MEAAAASAYLQNLRAKFYPWFMENHVPIFWTGTKNHLSLKKSDEGYNIRLKFSNVAITYEYLRHLEEVFDTTLITIESADDNKIVIHITEAVLPDFLLKPELEVVT